MLLAVIWGEFLDWEGLGHSRSEYMNLFNGRTGRCLHDGDGHVSYIFVHEGGAQLVLRVTREAAAGLENKHLVVKGKFIAPATILAAEVQIDLSSPKVSFLSRWTKKTFGKIAGRTSDNKAFDTRTKE